MNGITKEQIEQARRVGILAYMRAYEPQELVKVGRSEYTTRTHDSLRISENGKWNWCSRGFGGTNALNYLVRVKGLSFVSAVQQLCEDIPAPAASASQTWERPPNSQTLIPFSEPVQDRNNVAALRYLRGRGIRDPVLNYCIEQGLLYQTDHKGYKNCVFIGRDGAGKSQYACVRGCSGGWRGDVAGSQKQFAFRIPARGPDASRVEVYEAPIDALSGASLRILAGRDWRTFLRFPLARFYLVDPEREYCAETRALGGVVVDISVDSRTYFNPLDFVYDPVSKIPPHTAKAEFVLSLCEQVMGKEHLLPGDKSLIDRSLKRIYQPFVKRRYQGVCPTLTDLWRDLNAQDNERAKEIALALEIFANGSLNMFAQPTNVDMSNRLICFNIQSLGDQLKSVAMLSMLEFINTQVMQNDRSDPDAATWVYFDEIYLLLRNELSAHFLYVSWKRFRKYNAYATGITQSVQDCLSNDTAYAMLANSEFVVLLRQTKDIDSVAELYGLSEPQKNYLLLARPGQGILKLGNSLIPFENEYPKNKTYQLLTTKPGEMEQ